MFCEKCGFKMEDGAECCPSCGNKTGINTMGSNAGAASGPAGKDAAGNGVGTSMNYKIPDRVVSEHPLDKIKRNKKRIVHFIGCLLMVIAVFRPYVAYDAGKIMQQREESGYYSDSALEKMEEEMEELADKRNEKEASNYTAVNICDELDVPVLVVVFFITLVIGIVLFMVSKYAPAIVLELLGSLLMHGYIIIKILDEDILRIMGLSTGFAMTLIAWAVLIASGVIKDGPAGQWK